MMLTTSFSMTAVARHYVKIVNTTNSINNKTQYKQGDVLPDEVDSADVYIHILKEHQKESLQRNGVKTGAKFKITNNTGDPKTVGFKDDAGEDRDKCYAEGEILVKVGEDFLKFDDVKFLNSSDVDQSKERIRNEIKAKCKYDSKNKCLDVRECPYPCVFKNATYNKEEVPDVTSDDYITFLTTSQDIPNIIFRAEELEMPSENVVQGGGFVRWIKDNWIIVLCALFVIGFLSFLIYRMQNKKYSNKSEWDSDDDNTLGASLTTKEKYQEKDIKKQHGNVAKETANQNIVDSKESTLPMVDEKLYQKIADVLVRVENTQNALSKQSATLESIKLLVSNTEDKKQLAQKIQELETEKKKTANAITERDSALSDIEKLKKDIAQLQAGSQIEGAIQVAEYSTFVSFAKKVVSECAEAENLVIKYWCSLNSKEQQVLNGFLSKFQMTKCCIDLAKWNGILATLDLKGYIKNDEYITYLTPLSDKDRMVFLNKRFFEDILRPYVGAIILFLEQIRTANKIGVSTVCNENIEGFINSICTRCREQGVLVDYRKLYENVSEYDSLEIDENIPDTIKKVITNVEKEDILLYVDKYAVNLKSGEIAEKTRCYIKI